MTNFEKWRDSLTPEDLLWPRFLDGGKTKCVHIQCENNCPAYKACPMHKAHEAKKRDEERIWRIGDNCDKHFLRWANAPAKEEEK